MGQNFVSVRQGVNEIADRWARSSRSLRKKYQKYGVKLAKMAKMHSSKAFIACADPLKAVIFSVLIEMIKYQENRGCSSEIPGNEHPKDGVRIVKYCT